ncbi:MAG: DUF1993 family protein, partial [Proteobacteria bacterium]|nr:DUF1993 family protein [Pseudomonadota bacterium]
MTISMYSASVPVLRHMLANLAGILGKAAAHAAAKKIDPAVLLNARLFPDMFPLLKQVQITTDNAKGVARLAGVEVPKYEDNEAGFEELQARIAKTMAFLDTLRPDQVDGSEQRDIVVQLRDKKYEFKGQDFLLKRLLPNFYFH